LATADGARASNATRGNVTPNQEEVAGSGNCRTRRQEINHEIKLAHVERHAHDSHTSKLDQSLKAIGRTGVKAIAGVPQANLIIGNQGSACIDQTKSQVRFAAGRRAKQQQPLTGKAHSRAVNKLSCRLIPPVRAGCRKGTFSNRCRLRDHSSCARTLRYRSHRAWPPPIKPRGIPAFR